MTFIHPNIDAYKDVESLDTFNDHSFRQYCDLKMKECNKHIDFIKSHLSPIINDKTYQGRVIEIGSGNGKLLYALEKERLLQYGLGFELSRSRCDFAEQFGQYTDSKNVKIVCDDFLNYKTTFDYDLIIGVDIVAQLIAPVSDSAEYDLLKAVFKMLKPGGVLIFELMDFSPMIHMYELNGGKLRLWKEFDDHDPWQFGLDSFSKENDNVIYDKLFISRDRTIEDSSFRNILRQYSFDDIKAKLIEVGFHLDNIRCHSYWSKQGDIHKDEFIVTACK